LARQVNHVNLVPAQAMLDSFNLHLDSPTKILIDHLQLLQRTPADNAHRTKIAITHSPNIRYQGGRQGISCALLWTEGSTIFRHAPR